MANDTIRVWDENTGEMTGAASIRELLLGARHDNSYVWADEYFNHVFMRNTGIYDQSLAIKNKGSSIEIFENDLITHGSEPYLYRVAQKRGCWWAESLYPRDVPTRLLIDVWNPRVVGNTLENKDLFLAGMVCTDGWDSGRLGDTT